MASSFFKGFAPSTDRSTLDLMPGSPCSFSERGLGLHGYPQSLSLPSPFLSVHAYRSTLDHTEPLTSRSSRATAIRSFVIAAATAVGLSLCSFDCFAIAAELEVNDSAILSMASVQTNPNIKPVSGKNEEVTLVVNPSDSSNPDQNHSFSMAIPVPYEKVWADVQNGFIAPLHHLHEHGSSTDTLLQPRKMAMASSEGSALQCPRWTPSDLEMVLPDFHGRPKPFPHQGHHWSASFVITDPDGETFLQMSAAHDELQLTEIGKTDRKTTNGVKGKIEKEIDRNFSLLEVLGMEKFTCYSM